MKKLRININGKEVIGHPSQTILDVATENGIFIPTFCYDERTHIHGACGICVVEVEGMPKLMKACATEIADGFVIKTDIKTCTLNLKNEVVAEKGEKVALSKNIAGQWRLVAYGEVM